MIIAVTHVSGHPANVHSSQRRLALVNPDVFGANKIFITL